MVDFSDIITSRVRGKLLELFFADVTEMYHIRGASRKLKEEINSVRRELDKMENWGIVKKETRGNRIYYWPRPDYPYFGDLLSIYSKSTGLGRDIVTNRKKIGKVNYVMFSGRFARRLKRKKEDEVDILVVGDIILPELSVYIRKEES